MASKLDKYFSVLRDTKTRAILIIVAAIVIIVVAIAYFGIRSTQEATPKISLKQAPRKIKSIPGVGTPSREYVKAQEVENLIKAQRAAKTGKSAIPTITRTGYIPSAEFAQAGAAVKPGCSVEELKRARTAGVKTIELRCAGCSAAQLRAAGYTAGELRSAGFGASELAAAGFSADELRDTGFTAAELRRAGFDPDQMKSAGYGAAEMLQAGFTPEQLQGAGYGSQSLAAAGIGAAAVTDLPKDCSVTELSAARSRGLKAEALRRIGCSAAALRAAGYSAQELKAAGFSADELKQAGFSTGELIQAGLSAGDLKRAGFNAQDLLKAGVSVGDLRDAGFTAAQLKTAGVTAAALKQGGYSEGELVRAGYSQDELVKAGVSTDALKAAGLIPEPKGPESAFQTLAKMSKSELLTPSQGAQMARQLQTSMGATAKDLISGWAPPQQQLVTVSAALKPDQAATNGQAGTAAGAASGSTATAPTSVIKAGTVMFGVLDTAINSDEKSPIMATIVQGPLKGSKLLGNFKRIGKTVVVAFDILNIPSATASQQIKAVAISPVTARTALASHVDNHYLLRYGTLFASSFVGGLADAISKSGSTVTITLFGSQEETPDLNTGEKAMVALGSVGKAFNRTMSPIFNKPPTITVKEGSGIGILFTSDATVPLKIVPKQGNNSTQTG